MTNKLSKQYNYAEMSVLNVKLIKVTKGENKYNFPLQVSPRGGGGGMIHFVNSRVVRGTVWELEGSTTNVIQPGNWRGARDAALELEGSTLYSLGTGGVHVIQPGNWRGT